MALSQSDCAKFNAHMFDRVPHWKKQLSKDRFPMNDVYRSVYNSDIWANGEGAEKYADRVHVTAVNDNGCWDEVVTTPCTGTPCDVPRNQVGWGSTRRSFGRFKRNYQTPPFCYEQLKNLAEVTQQVADIYDGLKKIPDQVISSYIRLWAQRSADYIYIAGSSDTRIAVSDGMFTNQCSRLDLGGTGNLPTSKLTMEYLEAQVPELLGQGYFNQNYDTGSKITIMADAVTRRNLTNANPALRGMYNSADFSKGGKYYELGVVDQFGSYLFKDDTEQIRYQHIGNGVLERVYPCENVVTTVGKRPKYSTAYNNAPYAAYHIYNRASRVMYFPDASPIGGGTKFGDQVYNGTWQWLAPDVIIYTDPNTGVKCTLQNDLKNKGYWVGQFELGFDTIYPELERIIIAQREPQIVINDPRCASTPAMVYQSLTPYNQECGDEGGDLDLDPGALS